MLINRESSAYIFSALIFRLEKVVSVSAHNDSGFPEDYMQFNTKVLT